MIKTAIILLLGLLLAGAAAFTKPSEADFISFVHQQKSEDATNVVTKVFASATAESYLKDCVYHNRVLWADVQKDGKTIYVGAFSHWFDKSDPMAKPAQGHQ